MCGQQNGRDVDVVLNQGALGNPKRRPERLPEVGEADLALRHRQRDVVGVGRDRHDGALATSAFWAPRIPLIGASFGGR